MRLKRLIITILLFMTFGTGHGSSQGVDDNNVGIQLEFKGGFKEGLQGLLGGFTKPMKSCYLSEPRGGFNHTKRKVKLCTEEQRKVISEYMGTFEGNYSGSSNGKVTISIHDDGVIEGYRETDGVKHPLGGSATFVNRPTQNYLQIHVVSVISVKNRNQQLNFRGTIKKDGVLSTNWSGSGKKGSRLGGQIQLSKTAPHKKRVVVKAKDKPKKKIAAKPSKPPCCNLSGHYRFPKPYKGEVTIKQNGASVEMIGRDLQLTVQARIAAETGQPHTPGPQIKIVATLSGKNLNGQWWYENKTDVKTPFIALVKTQNPYTKNVKMIQVGRELSGVWNKDK